MGLVGEFEAAVPALLVDRPLELADSKVDRLRLRVEGTDFTMELTETGVATLRFVGEFDAGLGPEFRLPVEVTIGDRLSGVREESLSAQLMGQQLVFAAQPRLFRSPKKVIWSFGSKSAPDGKMMVTFDDDMTAMIELRGRVLRPEHAP